MTTVPKLPVIFENLGSIIVFVITKNKWKSQGCIDIHTGYTYIYDAYLEALDDRQNLPRIT